MHRKSILILALVTLTFCQTSGAKPLPSRQGISELRHKIRSAITATHRGKSAHVTQAGLELEKTWVSSSATLRADIERAHPGTAETVQALIAQTKLPHSIETNNIAKSSEHICVSSGSSERPTSSQASTWGKAMAESAKNLSRAQLQALKSERVPSTTTCSRTDSLSPEPSTSDYLDALDIIGRTAATIRPKEH